MRYSVFLVVLMLFGVNLLKIKLLKISMRKEEMKIKKKEKDGRKQIVTPFDLFNPNSVLIVWANNSITFLTKENIT